MGAQGTAVVDFGAFPGKSDTSVVITGQGSIASGSLVEAWISADEHLADPPFIVAGAVVAGTGFTIYALCDTLNLVAPVDPHTARGSGSNVDNPTCNIPPFPMPYGQWNVAWAWN